MAKLCEPPRLAVNLKVKLESGDFKQWDGTQVLNGLFVYLKRGSIKD